MSPRLSQAENRIRELESLSQRLISWRATLEDRMDKQVRHGKVTDVDTTKQLVRIEVARKDGTSTKSDWVPYAQHAGPDGQGSGQGEYKFHNPPVVGQQMTQFSPNGDFRQAIIFPFTWHDKAASPSTATDTKVQTYGKQKIEQQKQLWRGTVDTTVREQKPTTITDNVTQSGVSGDGQGAAPNILNALSGMVTQAQSLVTAGAGLPGIQGIGSQIAGMASQITSAGGSTAIASSITALGTSMASSLMGGMSGLLSGLMSHLSSLTSMLNPGGMLSQALHSHIIDAANGILHSAFQGKHTVKLGSDGVSVTSIAKVTSTAPQIPHNGQVYNSDNTYTTGSDLAAAFPLISDARLKSNINDHPSVLDKIMSLQLKTFDVKKVDWQAGEIHSDPPRSSLGLLAQDVQALFPEIVHGDKFLAIEESKIGVLLMAAFQEFVIETREAITKIKAI
jgi:phage baseplate assembly protein gpV